MKSDDEAKEAKRLFNVQLLNDFGEETRRYNVDLRRDLNLQFFVQNPTELLSAMIDNPVLPPDLLQLALSCISSPSIQKDGGSERIQKLIGEQASQHGAIDLLLSMNEDLDDILQCLEDDISDILHLNSKEFDDALTEPELVDCRNSSGQAFIRSLAFANLLESDFNDPHSFDGINEKTLEAIGRYITIDLFCLQQFCILLSAKPSNSLVSWLLEFKARENDGFERRLWLLQDHTLLTKISSKNDAFYKSYLRFLVQELHKSIQKSNSNNVSSPTWHSRVTLPNNETENLKERLRALTSVACLHDATKAILLDEGLLEIIE